MAGNDMDRPSSRPIPEDEWLRPPARTLGLRQLYPNPTPDAAEIRTRRLRLDVVAVHGLGGDSYSTFTRDDCLWIRDMLPICARFQDARIMTFGYDARAFLHPFARSTTGRTFTFAEELLGSLADRRTEPEEMNRPIIFIGYSLGGIVIKGALRHAHALPTQYGNILDSTQALVFFGTPHQGSEAAAWASFLGSVGRAVGVRTTEVVEELKRWSFPLVELTTTFAELAPRFAITTFFEKKKTNGMLVSHTLLNT
ncbi:hypothetical protein CMEL01_16554 [Colletotrichum melonis]|uniref:DUF676 domain-containing protein n=1 Tax=Colletotrichum melonis TaxID=1209925 RepID=A0AAI9UD28_9PEZI|nr:hypothetical protein CMEL01_16554 [Colletotrichum melonis]